MSIQFPSELDWLAPLVSGGTWPGLDEDETRGVAGLVDDSAAEFQQLVSLVADALAVGGGSVGGQGGADFDSYIKQLTSDGPQVLRQAIDNMGQMSDGLRQTANQIEMVKLQIIEMLAWLAAELIWAAISSIFDFGISDAADGPLIEGTNAVILAIARNAISEIAKGAAIMGAMDALNQAILDLQGNASGFNVTEMFTAAGMGALASAFGAGLGLGLNKIAPDLSKNFLGKTFSGAVVGGTSNYLGQITGSALQGNPDFSPGGFIAGAFGGAIGGALHGGHNAPGETPPPDIPKLDEPLPPPEGFFLGSITDGRGLPLFVEPNGSGSYLVHSISEDFSAPEMSPPITEPAPDTATTTTAIPDAAITGADVPVQQAGSAHGGPSFGAAVSELPNTLIVGKPGEQLVGSDGGPLPTGTLGDQLGTVWAGVRDNLPPDAPMPAQVLLTSPVDASELSGVQKFADAHGVSVLAPDGLVTPSPDGRALIVDRPGGNGSFRVLSPQPGDRTAETAGAPPPVTTVSELPTVPPGGPGPRTVTGGDIPPRPPSPSLPEVPSSIPGGAHDRLLSELDKLPSVAGLSLPPSEHELAARLEALRSGDVSLMGRSEWDAFQQRLDHAGDNPAEFSKILDERQARLDELAARQSARTEADLARQDEELAARLEALHSGDVSLMGRSEWDAFQQRLDHAGDNPAEFGKILDERQARLDELSGQQPGADIASKLPEVPKGQPGHPAGPELPTDQELADRLLRLKLSDAKSLGMPAAERRGWRDQITKAAQAGHEAAETRLNQLLNVRLRDLTAAKESADLLASIDGHLRDAALGAGLSAKEWADTSAAIDKAMSEGDHAAADQLIVQRQQKIADLQAARDAEAASQAEEQAARELADLEKRLARLKEGSDQILGERNQPMNADQLSQLAELSAHEIPASLPEIPELPSFPSVKGLPPPRAFDGPSLDDLERRLARLKGDTPQAPPPGLAPGTLSAPDIPPNIHQEIQPEIPQENPQPATVISPGPGDNVLEISRQPQEITRIPEVLDPGPPPDMSGLHDLLPPTATETDPETEQQWQQYLDGLRQETGGGQGTLSPMTFAKAQQWIDHHIESHFDEAVATASGLDPQQLADHLGGVEKQLRTDAWTQLLGQLGVDMSSPRVAGLFDEPVPEHVFGGPLPVVATRNGIYFPNGDPHSLADRAAHAVLGAEGWTNLVGHGIPGGLQVEGKLVDAGQVLQVPGLPAAMAGAKGVAVLSCYAATPADGGRSFMQELDAGRGLTLLGPTEESIVTPDGDVISGKLGGVDQNGMPIVIPSGDWMVLEKGVKRSLGTSSLRKAYELLGVTPVASGLTVDRPVVFAYGLTTGQVQGLPRFGYQPVAAQVASAGQMDSFFTSLINVATPRLTARLGAAPTVASVRAALVDTLTRDLSSPAPRYARFIPPNTTGAQLIADLRNAALWNSHLGALAPHLAADAFDLRLGVFGALGMPEGAGLNLHTNLSGYADGTPLMLIAVGDNHFIPAEKIPAPAAGPAPVYLPVSLRRGPGPAGPWTRPLTAGERNAVNQSVRQAIEDPALHIEERADTAYAQSVAADFPELLPGGANVHQQAVEHLIAQALAGDQPSLDQLDILERVSDAITLAAAAPGPLNEAQLTTEFTNALQIGSPGQAHPGAVAQLAARVKAYEQIEAAVTTASTVRPPRGTGIRKLIADTRLATMPLVQTRMTQARQEADARGAPAQWARRHVEAARRQTYAGMVSWAVTPAALNGLAWAHAVRTRPVTFSARRAADAAIRARQAITRPLTEPARVEAEYHLRAQAAQLLHESQEPPRTLPPGFGEVAGGRQMFAFGYRGRPVLLGDASFGDDNAVLTEILRAMPAGQSAATQAAVRTGLLGELKRLGNRAFTQRALEGGLRFKVTVGAVVRDVTLRLGLGDLGRARNIPPWQARLRQGGEPAQQELLGSKEHGAVEAPRELTQGTRDTMENTRSVSVTGNVLTPFGEAPAKVFSMTVGATATGTSSHGFSAGSDGVSATKRFLDLEGHATYFDFSEATISLNIKPHNAGAAVAGQTGQHTSSLRLAFPRELAPPMDPNALGPVLPGTRHGAGNPVLGVNVAALNAAAPGPAGDAVRQQAERVGKVLRNVLTVPESMSGLDALRTQVKNALPGNSAEVGSQLHEGIEDYLSEPTMLKTWGDLIGPGALSPLYEAGGDGRHGAHLTVASKLLTAQRVDTEHVVMKEESQRWVNTQVHGETDSGSFGITLPSARLGYTIGDPTADFGFNHSAAFQFQLDTSIGTSRTSGANTGAGEVRGLIYNGPSVRYRMTMRTTVTADTNLPGAGAGPLGEQDIEMYVRVPVQQAARFEALIRKAIPVPGTPAHAAIAVPLDDGGQPWTAASPHPPLSLAASEPTIPASAVRTAGYGASHGIGFSAIERLAGSEQILPEMISLLRKVEFARAWAPEWSPLSLAYLKRQLYSKFSREALINRGSALFQPRGVKERLFRAVDGGTEVMTFEVRAERQNVPHSTGQIANAKLELMPAGFGGADGTDTLSSSLGGSASFNFTGGIGSRTEDDLRQFGVTVSGSGSTSVKPSTTVGASAFQLQAMLYDGPARTFDYNVEYVAHVRVKFVPARQPAALPGLAAGAAYNAVSGAHRNAAYLPEPTMGTRFPGGQVRFVVPEGITSAAPHAAAAMARRGRMVRHAYAVPAVTKEPGLLGLPNVTLPDLPPALRAAHSPLNTDDLVMETIGSHHVQDEISTLLTQAGLSADEAGDISWTIGGTEQLSGSMVRGPSEIKASFTAQGLITDKSVTVKIEGFPVNLRGVAGPGLRFLKMNVAEGGQSVGGSHGKSKDSSFAATAAFGALLGDAGGGSQQMFPALTYQRDLFIKPETVTRSSALSPISGRLTQITENFREHVADMVYRITVIRQNENMVYQGRPRVHASLIQVNDGISFFRSDGAHASPHARPFVLPPLGTPPLIRTAQPINPAVPAADQTTPTVADKIVPTVPATPAAGAAQIPAVPLIPHAAASEKLIERPGGLPAGVNLDVTGQGNALLHAVQQVVLQGAPGMLEDYWEVTGLAQNLRPLPAKLSTLLNTGSAEALLDVMLGPGLVLHSTRSLPLSNQRMQLVIRAQRDPNNRGYYFLEHAGDANVSRYWFRLNRNQVSVDAPRNSALSLSARTAENVPAQPDPAQPGGTVDYPLASAAVTPSIGAERSTVKSVSLTKVNASRNTFFINGPADRYVGDIRFEISLSKITLPSRAANSVLVNTPRMIGSQLSRASDQLLANARGQADMLEQVLVPKALMKPDLQPLPAPPRPAVEEIAFNAPANTRGAVLPVTGKMLMDRQAFSLGFDPRKLQVLADEVLTRASGQVRPMNRSQSFTVARTIERGTRAREAVMEMLSYPMMTQELDLALDHEGLVSPALNREGGPLTDNRVTMKIDVELVNPRVLNHVNGWLESNTYHFTESQQSRSVSHARSASVAASTTGVTGDLNASLPPGDHTQQKPSGTLSLGLKQTRGRSSYALQKMMPRVTSRNRKLPWLRVGADALVKVTLTGKNPRGSVSLPGGEVTMAFHVRDATELAMGPELVEQFGLAQPHGVPTQAGYYFPARNVPGVRNDDSNSLHAAFSMPKVNNATVLHLHTDAAGNIVVDNQVLTVAQFAARIVPHLDLPPGPDHVLIVVGCNTAPIAAQLGGLLGRHAIGANSDVVTKTDGSVLAAQFGVDVNGVPIISTWQRRDFVLFPLGAPPGGGGINLGHDLLSVLRTGGLIPHVAPGPGVNYGLLPGDRVLPPLRDVWWSAGGADSFGSPGGEPLPTIIEQPEPEEPASPLAAILSGKSGSVF